MLFGSDYDDPVVRKAYDESIRAACLLPDLSVLKEADLTEIGERGINLSGGQKARVSIARALLRTKLKLANLVLLDDPFSAVDGDTGNHIFHRGVRQLVQQSSSSNEDNDSTSPLVVCCLNSHMHLLAHFSRIIVLNEGRIEAYGGLSELMADPDRLNTVVRCTGMSKADLSLAIERSRSRAGTSAPNSAIGSRAVSSDDLASLVGERSLPGSFLSLLD